MERQNHDMANSTYQGPAADDNFRRLLTNGDRRQQPTGNSPDAAFFPSFLEINPYHSYYISPYDSQLDSQFSRMSLTRSPADSAAAYITTQPQPSPEEQIYLRTAAAAAEIRRMRIQSAARALSAQPQNSGVGRLNGAALDYQPLSNYSYSGMWRSNGADYNYTSQYRTLSDRIQPNNFLSLRDYRGRIVSMAKGRHGCQFLQQKIEDRNFEEIQMILAEIKDHVCELMVHPFGNELIQKLVCFCNEDQKYELLMSFTKDDVDFCTVCTHTYGTKPVQVFIDSLRTKQQIFRFMTSVRRNIVPLSSNPIGINNIKYCLYRNIEDDKHILHGIADNCLDIATDKNGCCLVQDCLTYAHVRCPQAWSRLVSVIACNTLFLSEHLYGNYVVQQVLRLRTANDDIMSQLGGNYVSLSMNKHGSHVVERCLEVSTEHQKLNLIEEIFDSPNLLRVLQDPYGNYVAQFALGICKGAIRDDMIAMIQVNYPNLQSHPYGKLVLERVKKILN